MSLSATAMGSDQKVDGHPSAGPFPDPHHHRCSLFLGLMSRQTRFQLKSSANNIAVTVSIAVLALFLTHLLCGFLHRRVRKAWLAAGRSARGGHRPHHRFNRHFPCPKFWSLAPPPATIGDRPGVSQISPSAAFLGSVFVQITLIMGIVVVNRGLEDSRVVVEARRPNHASLRANVLSFFLITEGTLERWEAGILVTSYVVYITWLLTNRKEIPGRGTRRHLFHPILQGSSTGPQQLTLSWSFWVLRSQCFQLNNLSSTLKR